MATVVIGILGVSVWLSAVRVPMLKPIMMCAPGTMKVTDVTFPLRAMGAALRCSLARPIIPAAMLVIYPVSMPPPCRADRAAERILLSNRFTTCFTAGWRPPFRWTASCQAFARRVYSAGVSKFAAVEAIVIDVDDDRVAILDESDWSAEKGLRCDVADHQAHRSARESCVHSRFGTYWGAEKRRTGEDLFDFLLCAGGITLSIDRVDDSL